MASLKRAENRKLRHQYILDVAEQLMREKGLYALHMDEVAQRSGLAKGTLYLYFKSKEEILAALTLKARQLLHEAFKAAVAQTDDPLLQLGAIIKANHSFLKNNALYYNLVSFYEIDERQTEGEEMVAVSQAIIQLVIEIIVSGQQRGLINRAMPPAVLALSMWGTTVGVMQLLRVRFGNGPLHGITEADVLGNYVEVFLRGIAQNDYRSFLCDARLYLLLNFKQRLRAFMENYTTDVLIVGAGPTGLALANALTQLGTTVMLIEAGQSTSIHTKATNLMQGTLEQLAIYGLTEAMYAQGGKMERYMMGLYGANVGPRSMVLTESPHSQVLFLGQNLIDATLATAFTARGHHIHFKHRLAKLQQTPEGVQATITTDAGDASHHFKYVVGCDGPRSTTRTFTNCDFEPIKTGKYVWQVDATLHWKRLKTMQQMWLYYYDIGFGAVIHLPNNVTKVMAFEPKESMPNRVPTLEEMQQKLRQMSGDATATLTNPTWLSHGELLTGVAPALIDKRILLAGDACNPILPNGGQGLNVGIQDALNLAWKLHDVLKGYASDSLLATFSTERRSIRLALEKVQLSTLKYTLPAPRINQIVLKRFGNGLMNKFWPKLARVFSQLDMDYKQSPLTVDALSKKGTTAGTRVLDAVVVQATTHQEVSLFDTLCTPTWKAILFDGGQQQALSAFWADERFQWLQRMVLTNSTTTTYPESILYYDIDEVAHKRYGIQQPQILLVRPDNYVALRLPVSKMNLLPAYLAKWYPNLFA